MDTSANRRGRKPKRTSRSALERAKELKTVRINKPPKKADVRLETIEAAKEERKGVKHRSRPAAWGWEPLKTKPNTLFRKIRYRDDKGEWKSRRIYHHRREKPVNYGDLKPIRVRKKDRRISQELMGPDGVRQLGSQQHYVEKIVSGKGDEFHLKYRTEAQRNRLIARIRRYYEVDTLRTDSFSLRDRRVFGRFTAAGVEGEWGKAKK